MNNKGFAITGILYGLMILFVIVITSFLAVVVGKSKRDNEVLNNVKESLSLNSSETVYWSKFNYANYGWTYNGYRYSYVTDRRALYTFENDDYDTCVSMYLPKGTVVIIDSEGRLSYSLYGSENEAEFKEMSDSCYGELYNKPNSPDLVDGLIPVVYNETTSKWVKADSTNENNSWYNYNEKKWANAVLVTSVNRSIYQNAKSGEEILDNDILAFYVWIPRYKYKVWNINKVIRKDSYSAQISGIDVIFEKDKAKTGNITCTDYSFAIPSGNKNSPNEICSGTNGDYYTHPAFTFGDNELRGFWIGKFELSSETPTVDKGGGNSSTLTARILPNVNSWRKNTVSNFSTVIQNMQNTDNIYGLPTSKSVADSHMIKNMEWGAVAYLTNSSYGRCSGGTCTEVTNNDCNTYITGIGADTVSASNSLTTCTTDANKYNGEKGVLASTTGNVYGVYDMSGGAHDYVMGNMSSTADSYTFNNTYAKFSSDWYSSNQKYIDTYANYSASGSTQASYNRARLGDATGEVAYLNGNGWYSDSALFPNSSNSWFARGGYYINSSNAGIFNFGYGNGGAFDFYSTRATLVSLK